MKSDSERQISSVFCHVWLFDFIQNIKLRVQVCMQSRKEAMHLLWDWQGESREEGDAEVGLSKYIIYLSKDVLMKPGTMNSECILFKESQTNKTEKNTDNWKVREIDSYSIWLVSTVYIQGSQFVSITSRVSSLPLAQHLSPDHTLPLADMSLWSLLMWNKASTFSGHV